MPRDEGEITRAAVRGSSGSVELLADEERPGGWLLLIDRIRQSYVDVDDPTYLDFEYVQAFADILDALPPGPLAVTHIGGGACTVVRYLSATRHGSPQIVLEPDAAVTAMVRALLPFNRGTKVRIRPVGGREGMATLADASADVVVLDAFFGGRVPADLTTSEFVAEVSRVLKSDGVLLINVADGPPATFTKRLLATVRGQLPHILVCGDGGVLKMRRFGNLVIAASATQLPTAAVARAAARAVFARKVLAGRELTSFIGSARELTDVDPLRSPQPPDEIWRVG